MAQLSEYKYKNRRVILTNDIQEKAFKMMASYGVNISQFIRSAVKEKISKDWSQIKENHKNELEKKDCPF